MASYLVSGLVTISVSTVVEADSEAEAKEKAIGMPMMGLCYRCARGADEHVGDEEWRTSGELDGEPYDLTAEVVP